MWTIRVRLVPFSVYTGPIAEADCNQLSQRGLWNKNRYLLFIKTLLYLTEICWYWTLSNHVIRKSNISLPARSILIPFLSIKRYYVHVSKNCMRKYSKAQILNNDSVFVFFLALVVYCLHGTITTTIRHVIFGISFSPWLVRNLYFTLVVCFYPFCCNTTLIE